MFGVYYRIRLLVKGLGMGGEQQPEGRGTPVGRRVILGLLGVGAVGVVVGKPVGDAVSRLTRSDPTGLTGFLPATAGFRYYSVVSVDPVIPRSEYQLQVGGLVDRPRSWSFADLEAMPQTGLTRDFQCVTGWRVPDVPWSGVLLSEILSQSGVQPSAGAVAFDSYDGEYTESLTLEQARRPDMLVATRMFGEPIADPHGGPVRLLVAPMYGYKSLKWLSGIRLTANVEPGYWEQRGYAVDAWVGSSNGRRDEPV